MDLSSTVSMTEQVSLQCADEASLQTVELPTRLGPLDQRYLLGIPLAVVFVYRSTNSAVEELIPIDRLRRALERLLDFYPHLTGRILVDPVDKAPRIEQLGAGAKLVSAQCSEPLTSFETVKDDGQSESSPQLIVTNLPDGGNALLPEFDATEAGAGRDAILTVQHTRFACGSVSVALRLRHIICDASGIQSLFSDLQLSTEERLEALAVSPTLFELAPEAPDVPDNIATPERVIGRVLRFSSTELARIKAAANADKENPVSTFCALAAHLWQSIYRARTRQCRAQCLSSHEAALQVPRQSLASLDLRSRSQLNISPRYFPNCVLCPVFSLSAAELLDAPLSTIAAAVHKGVQRLDPAEVQRNLRWLAAQPDKDRVRLRYQGGVMVSQWNKFEMYRGSELDVPPALVAQPFTPISLIDGLIYFMATEDQLNQSNTTISDSIDVSMALNESVWAEW
ncbi:uncharacterized protein PITG_06068 [Phytophthora infestans T30-4]|uniref:Uncharacterized protein n=1 Tax=Phytophthora infestans (strain T30-4) TaxID=403677 RepID=D0N6B8_PHYIT|nr:uncharacterized protein PITG_06068 [Phytophthora infestans T30-4]EEY70609.1 conserved hypothetical protein [Phytophthora infestans T30-4]|eukprot:XP_002998263.1 conserved hypothetical protein [Phytophthora infestans T30-4]